MIGPSTSLEHNQEIHGPVIPGDVFMGGPITAQIKESTHTQYENLSVYRISPFGVELTYPIQEALKFNYLHAGNIIDLVIKMGTEHCQFNGIVVSLSKTKEGNPLIGLRWYKQEEGHTQEPLRSERRKDKRWNCPEEFLPTGTAPNPSQFNDFIYFQMRNLSKNGARLSTSLRNRFIIPGIILDATVSLPMFGSIRLKLKVMDVRTVSIRGKDYLSLGTQFVKPTKYEYSMMSNYILQFASDLDMEDARIDGILSKVLSNKVTYSYVKTKDEYQEVLELRRKSYLAVGKLNEEITSEQLSDEYDSRSRILTARYHGKLVASLRTVFHLQTDRLEIQKYIELPKDLPPRDQFVEVSRFCIDPSFQGGDIIFGMMQQLFVIMTQAKRRWIVSFADEKMMKSFYRPFGAQSIGEKFDHPVLKSIPHEAFLFDIEKLITGQTVGPVLWNLLLADIYKYLKVNQYYTYDQLTQVRIGIYKLFKPLAALMRKKLMEPKFLKRSQKRLP